MTTRTHIETTEVAKIIRAELKANFPGQKFSVKSNKYSGGSSIDVSWTDGPTRSKVEAVIGHYHGASFDGMIDLKNYHDSQYQGQAVHFGNDYLFCTRHISPGLLYKAVSEYVTRYRPDVKPVIRLSAYGAAYIHSSDYRVSDAVHKISWDLEV